MCVYLHMEKPNEFRNIEYKTTFRNLNGSWYCLIPVEFAKHMQLEGDASIEGLIRSEQNKNKQPYCSVWKKGT